MSVSIRLPADWHSLSSPGPEGSVHHRSRWRYWPQPKLSPLLWFTERHWRAEVWWCPGRLLDWMPPTKF